MSYIKPLYKPLLTIFFMLLGFCQSHNLTEQCEKDWNHYNRSLVEFGNFWAKKIYVNLVPPDKNRTLVYCLERPDLSQDSGAIIAITIMSFFGAIVTIATVFDVFYFSTKYKNPSKSKQIKDERRITLVSKHMTFDTTQGEKTSLSNAHATNGTANHGYTQDVKKFVQHGIANSLERDPQKSSFTLTPDTTSDSPAKPGNLAALLVAFSLYTNLPRLLKAKHTPGSFSCLHGIRFITMCGVVWGHGYTIGLYVSAAPMIRNPYPALKYDFFSFVSEAFYQMWLIVDTFFLMSGFLVCYSLMKAISKHNNRVSVRMMVMYYFHRYWRLTPVYMLVIMMFTTLTYYFIQGGPMNTPQKFISFDCRDIWWRNLLYIQNLWPPENYRDCFGHAWYLAIDMQLYIVAPVFIILAYFYPIIGLPLMLAGYLGSIISNIVLYSKVLDGDVNDFVQIYIKPWTRANTYILGMFLGYIMFKTKGKVKIPKLLVLCGWVLALALVTMAMYLPYIQREGCEPYYDKCKRWTRAGKITWDSLISTMYVLGIAWIIFACQCGYGGFVNSFLSWNGWIPLSRLSYTAYLVHVGILAIYYYSAPVQFYFTHYIWLYQFCGNLIITMAVAFIVSLVFEAPMLGIEKVLLSRSN